MIGRGKYELFSLNNLKKGKMIKLKTEIYSQYDRVHATYYKLDLNTLTALYTVFDNGKVYLDVYNYNQRGKAVRISRYENIMPNNYHLSTFNKSMYFAGTNWKNTKEVNDIFLFRLNKEGKLQKINVSLPKRVYIPLADYLSAIGTIGIDKQTLFLFSTRKELLSSDIVVYKLDLLNPHLKKLFVLSPKITGLNKLKKTSVYVYPWPIGRILPTKEIFLHLDIQYVTIQRNRDRMVKHIYQSFLFNQFTNKLEIFSRTQSPQGFFIGYRD